MNATRQETDRNTLPRGSTIDRDTRTAMKHVRPDCVVLPSGCVISGETWEDIRDAGGDWRGWLDARMYSQADREFMDRAFRD